jgi:hypothetical protein
MKSVSVVFRVKIIEIVEPATNRIFLDPLCSMTKQLVHSSI